MPLRWIAIDATADRAPTVGGLVYRTAPLVGYASGQRYFFKDRGEETVVAEVLGYLLAQAVGLCVPEWALCRMPPTRGIWFASEAAGFSGGVEPLLRSRQVTNSGFLGDCVAFDVWVANTDRNVNNLVANSVADAPGRGELLAIDFEQARVLNGTNSLAVGGLHSRECWPREVLATHCAGLPFPEAMCTRIARMNADRVEEAIHSIYLDTEFVPPAWVEITKRQLVARGARITDLVREAWPHE